MESSKLPFIAEYDPYSKTRPLKQYRPVSTRPLCLSLFLAATGICFGLLLAISLIEKEPTTITKRDIDGDFNSSHEQRALSKRQGGTCTAYTTVSVYVTTTVCATPSSYVCPSPKTTTVNAAASTDDPCAVTMTLTKTESYLVLTTQDPSTQSTSTVPSTTSESYLSLDTQCTTTAYQTVTVCSPRSGYVCPTATLTAAPVAVGTGSCSTITLYMTVTNSGSYLSLTTQESTTEPTTALTQTGTNPGSYLSLTTQCTSTIYVPVTVCSPPSGYTCPPTTSVAAVTAAATGSCSTTRLTVYTTIKGSYLVLTTQASTPTSVSSVISSGISFLSSSESYLSLTSQKSVTSSPTLTETESYLVLTTESYLSLASQGSASTSVAAVSTSTGSYLVLTAQSSTKTSTSPVLTSAASSASSYLSLTTQGTTKTSTSSVGTQVKTSSIVYPGSLTPQETTSVYISPSSQGSTASPLLLVKTTTDPAHASLTSQKTTALLSTTAESYLYVTTMSSTTETVYGTTNSGDPSTTVLLSTNYLDLTTQLTTPSSLEGTLSQLSTTLGSSTTSELVPSANTAASESPTTYTMTMSHSTETMTLYPGVQTTLTAGGATYLVVASTDGVYSSLYTEQASISTAPSVTATTTSASHTSTQSTSTSLPGKNTDSALNQNQVLIKLQPFHTYYYFLALYLPKIIAVMMTALWTIIFGGLKLMEPFYQLSANTGAFASESMFGNYLASEISISSLSATFRGRWVLLLGGTVLIVWAAIVALVSESMNVISQGTCTDLNKPGSKPYRCNPGWVVNMPILKVLLVLTGLVFVLVLILILILGQRKRTGVFHDPSSIAAMAELLGNPMVMEDLQAIKPSSSDREVKLLLGENRYGIGLYDPSTGKEASFSMPQHSELRWGLIKLDQTPLAQTIANKRLAGYSAVLNPSIISTEELQANRKRRIFQLVYDTVMLLTALCIFALVLGYWLDAKADPMNKFFNSDTAGPRLVLTCLALVLSIGWRKTSQETTVMAPYRSMARAYEAQSGVMAGRSVLAAIAHTPWKALWRGLQLRYYMVTIVALCAVLADLLLIAVSGVPYRESQVMLSLKVCVFASLSILGIMILTSLAVIVHNRTSAGGTRRLPRSPNTLIGVWLYLCHSNLVNHDHGPDDFSSPLAPDELVAKYEKYQYGFTRKPGVDRVGRWTIDTVTGLRSWAFPPMHRYPQYQNHHQPDNNTEQQGLQPFEASATPVEQTHQNPFIHRTASRRQPNTSPYGVPYFEAQAKSPVAQAPPARFEELRPRTQIVQVTPIPQNPPVRREEEAVPMHEALAAWEYEQEFHDPRRVSAGSMYSGEGRWTNDGRSHYRYG